MSYSENRSLWIRSSEPISWLGIETRNEGGVPIFAKAIVTKNRLS